MRLIDADILKEYIKMGIDCGGTLEELFDRLDDIPTAYDIDKVLEEINKESWEYMSDFGDTRVIDFADAIEIVRRGWID